MEQDAKNLQKRWESLEKGNGLQRARFMARTLWFVALALCVLVVLGVTFKLPSAAPGAVFTDHRQTDYGQLFSIVLGWPGPALSKSAYAELAECIVAGYVLM